MEEYIRNIDAVYSVSNLGRFFKNGKEMKGSITQFGYVRITLYGRKYFLHRLIAEIFIPNPEGKPCVDHINTNRTDNRVENLRWVSHKENSNNPLSKKHMSEANKGRHHTEETRKKISEARKGRKPEWLIKPVLQFSKEGEFIREWESGIQIERELGYNNGNINQCCLNKPHYKSAYGYLWRFKDNN